MKTTLKAVTAAGLAFSLFTSCDKVKDKNDSAEVAFELKRPVPAASTGTYANTPAAPPSSTQEVYVNLPNARATGRPQSLTSTAAIEKLKDSTHLFIRTADIKCKVQNVANATYKVEDIIRQLGGYVSYTKLTSSVENTSSVPVSADSSLQITNYSVQNTMVIRVPNTNLDSALIDIAPLVTYLDFRTINANNTALEMLSNKLKQIRLAQHEQRMKAAIEAHAKKLAETTEAEDNVVNKQEQADNARISNLELTDQVKYSTINLSLYQPGVIEKTLVFNEKSVKPYEPGLLMQLSESVQSGWGLFVALVVFTVRLWPIALTLALGLIAYRKWKFKITQLPAA